MAFFHRFHMESPKFQQVSGAHFFSYCSTGPHLVCFCTQNRCRHLANSNSCWSCECSTSSQNRSLYIFVMSHFPLSVFSFGQRALGRAVGLLIGADYSDRRWQTSTAWAFNRDSRPLHSAWASWSRVKQEQRSEATEANKLLHVTTQRLNEALLDIASEYVFVCFSAAYCQWYPACRFVQTPRHDVPE